MKSNIQIYLACSLLALIGCDTGFQLFPTAAATGYVRLFGGTRNDEGKELIYQADNGAYTMLGSYGVEVFDGDFRSIDGTKLYVVQTDREGNLSWEHTVGATDGDGIPYIVEGVDIAARGVRSGVALSTAIPTGENLGGNRRMFLTQLTLNENNVVEEERKFFGDGDYDIAASAVEADPNNGGYVILGFSDRRQDVHTSAGIQDNQHDLLVIKIDADLNVVWEQQYGYVDEEFGSEIRVLPTGGYLVSGASVSPEFGLQTMLLKLDNEGRAVQVRRIGTSGYVFPQDMQLGDDNSFFLLTSVEGNEDAIRVEKYDLTSLDMIWQHDVELPEEAEPVGGESLGILSDNSIIVSGTVNRRFITDVKTDYSYDILLYHIDENGNNLNPEVWPQFYGDQAQDFAGRVLPQEEADGSLSGFVMTCTIGFGPSAMMGMIRTDANGQLDP